MRTHLYAKQNFFALAGVAVSFFRVGLWVEKKDLADDATLFGERPNDLEEGVNINDLWEIFEYPA